MNLKSNYYQVLEISQKATIDEVKTAFRRMAKVHHPDKNNNSVESNLLFRIVHQAYETLSCPEKKAAYDRFLKNSRVFKQSAPSSATQISGRRTGAGSAYLGGQFNYLLWEIEDLLDDLWKHHTPWADQAKPEKWILKILCFWDEWVLGPNGFPDYFYQARKIDSPGFGANNLSGRYSRQHMPYRDIRDYFYQIRVRMNKFIDKLSQIDLQTFVSGYNVTKLDALLEALRMAYYYIGAINSSMKTQSGTIAPFEFQNSCFGEGLKKLPEGFQHDDRF